MGDCSRTRKRVALSVKTISSQHRSIPFALDETHHMVSALALPPEDSPQKFHGQRGTVADNNTVDRKENCLAPLLTTQRSQCRFRGCSLLLSSHPSTLYPPPRPSSRWLHLLWVARFMRRTILNLYEIAPQTCCSWAGWNSRRRLTQGRFLGCRGYFVCERALCLH